jgi:hypothetical protein
MPRQVVNRSGKSLATTLSPRSRRSGSGQVNTLWQAPVSISATGGTITDVGEYRVHSFTSSGTFSVQSLGDFGGAIEYLIVAGGGGANDYGFGGAGGYRELTATVTATNYTITVGGGGTSAANNNPTKGGTTSAFSTSTTGGGTGGRTYNNGSIGGSGGGAGGANNGQLYGSGGAGNEGGYSPVEGYAGGGSGYDNPGGGGGAGGAGNSNGTGGIGRSNSYTGTSVTYGRGGQYLGTAPANSGNGGDLFGPTNGGSGIVVVRYRIE